MESAIRDQAPKDLRVFETMRWTPEEGVHNRVLHLARLARSCEKLGIAPVALEGLLDHFVSNEAERLRLSIGLGGDIKLESWPFTPLPEGTIWKVAIAQQQLRSDDPWLGIKTTRRELYNAARAGLPEGIDELVFLNERDEVCEGTITNVFVLQDDVLATPPLSSGLLPGVLRQSLLDQGKAKEVLLGVSDLQAADELLVGNSLRGLIRAELVNAV